MNLSIDTSHEDEENIDFDTHVKRLSSVFNNTKFPFGKIFTRLYDICKSVFHDTFSSRYVSIDYNKNILIEDQDYIHIENNGLIKSKQREYNTKTKETISSTFFFHKVESGILYQRRFDSGPQKSALFNPVTGNSVEDSSTERIELFNGVNEHTFVKKYTLSDYSINNLHHSIIYVLHEICTQYYASLLLREYEYPEDTFEIIIPHIRGIYIGCKDNIKWIEIHSEYIPNSTSESEINIYTLQKSIERIMFSRSRKTKRKSRIRKMKRPIKSSSWHSLQSTLQNKRKSVKKVASSQTRKYRRLTSKSSTFNGGNMQINPINTIIMLHNTIVHFFEYLKSNSLLHLDTANRNIYFYHGKLVIIDFGESYIVHPNGIYLSDTIIYPKPEYQHDGYPVSDVIHNLLDYTTKKESIKKWLYGELQDNLQKCYGGVSE
jgi:hypothetical protein